MKTLILQSVEKMKYCRVGTPNLVPTIEASYIRAYDEILL
jgi:hypothetical protein